MSARPKPMVGDVVIPHALSIYWAESSRPYIGVPGKVIDTHTPMGGIKVEFPTPARFQSWCDATIIFVYNSKDLEFKSRASEQESYWEPQEVSYPHWEKVVELKRLALPLMQWLEKNHDPHTKVIITSSGASLTKDELFTPHHPKG